MPMQSHSGLTGDPWHPCDRCGFKYHVSQLVRKGNLILCTAKCVDANDDREEIIRITLENIEEEPRLADILKSPAVIEDDETGFVF